MRYYDLSGPRVKKHKDKPQNADNNHSNATNGKHVRDYSSITIGDNRKMIAIKEEYWCNRVFQVEVHLNYQWLQA